MKRRVIKISDRRYRVELPGGDVSQFSYREKPRKWITAKYSYADFEPDEDRYTLSWEGLFLDTFRTEIDALLFIIRFGYSIKDTDLVPSEILADFQLTYEAGDWVDEWCCPDQHDVVLVVGKIVKPPQRNIRFEGYPRITPKTRAPRVPFWKDHRGKDRREVVAEIKIPELDFEELEKPKKRRRIVPRNWSDHSGYAYGGYTVPRNSILALLPDEECVFTLETGKTAEKAHQARKKKTSSLQK